MIKVLAIIFITIIALIGLIMYMIKQSWVNQAKKLRNKCISILRRFEGLEEDSLAILSEEYTEVKNYLGNLDNLLINPITKQIRIYIEDNKDLVDGLEDKIKEKKEKWEKYIAFKKNIDFIKVNIKNKINRLKDKANELILIEEESKEKVEKKLDEIVPFLQEILKKFEILQTTMFSDFDFTIMDDIEKEYSEYMEKADEILSEFNRFFEIFAVYITAVKRDSNFYLVLNQLKEGSLAGKSNASQADFRNSFRRGEINTSYKTFAEAYIGKRYNSDSFVSEKRIISKQSIRLKIINGLEINNIFIDLDEQKFKDIYKELPINKDYKEVDENGFPLLMDLTDIEIPVCKKEKGEFTIEYYINWFKDTSPSYFLKGELKEKLYK